ncbi:MFS general substrate transporter [Sanghuangporus baumii]|uniref:MFS general substrate transporter n=1 Tax=Sanghuangporus baumii TaxID=108892 RepID=A0A9Q5HR11_SANBA|nr:MFS general substrate transporter [Sanghuangporus baumii]
MDFSSPTKEALDDKVSANETPISVVQADSTGSEAEDAVAEFGSEDERRRLERNLLWKLDCRMSIMIVIYILNYIDRNNAAAARLRGFEEDLNLEGQEFNTLLSILYVGYIIMQIPSYGGLRLFFNHSPNPLSRQ